VQKSLIAGIVGLAIVMLFMLFYYRLPGLLADIALLIFSLITFALFRAIPVTLTLAGIAGFILSIGMAVDANVLIFARIKEELRTGKTIGAAVEAGFDHAWPSIRDSNVTTVIITIILYWFGNFFGASVIKGFALTLLISVLVSLFTAITVTRTLLRLTVRARMAQNHWWFGIDPPKAPTPPAQGGTQPIG
jgi:preprotein translocase subunit SecD